MISELILTSQITVTADFLKQSILNGRLFGACDYLQIIPLSSFLTPAPFKLDND